MITLLTYVKIGLLLFLIPDNKRFLPSAYEKAELMSRYIDEQLIKMTGETWDEFLEEGKVSGLQVMLKSFETLLQNDLDNAPLYLCEDEMVGNLSITKLSTGAHNGYPLHVRDVLPALCRDEIDEAGKCLVFERPTASGFHGLRSVEMMVKYYLSRIPNFVMPPLNRQNWGEYIKLLGDSGASKAVVDTLRAIRDNHRNPLMHPEDVLTMHEAVSLFSICQSMTEALVNDLQDRRLI